jgi:hypothetical protein
MIVDAALLIISALAVWSLVKLLRSRNNPQRRDSLIALAALTLPLLWEIVLPLGLVIGFPFLAQSSWPLTLLFSPDLGYWLLAFCAVLLATGSLRLALTARSFAGAGAASLAPWTPSSARLRQIAAGVLFLIATASYIVGNSLLTPAMHGSDRIPGVLLELVDAAAALGIALLLMPFLQRVSAAAALAYLVARIVEAGLVAVSAVGSVPFAFAAAMVALAVGSFGLCYALYAGGLVPRALSVLGFLGYAALFVSGSLTLLGSDMATWLFIPGAVFEIVFPLWLIVRGFGEATHARSRPVPEAAAAPM